MDKNALMCSSIPPVFLPVVYDGGEGGVCGGERVDLFRHDSRDAESDAYQVLSTISRYGVTALEFWIRAKFLGSI